LLSFILQKDKQSYFCVVVAERYSFSQRPINMFLFSHTTQQASLKNFILTLLFLASFVSVLSAQDLPKKLKVTGIVNTEDNKALVGASVVVRSVKDGATSEADRKKWLVGSDKNGYFSLDIEPIGPLYLEVTSIGFADIFLPLSSEAGLSTLNVGILKMEESVNNLTNVVVTASAKKPFMEMGVDRRVFNAEAMLTARGGNAVDLLRNIPGLNVDVNGGVQLRNSSPQIFVDGRPTLLTLEQIPSDDIEKVEVITNPSSKYDAGSTGGILNIVLKKNRRNGMNGLVSAGIGSPGVSNANLSLNYRQGKLNFFVSASHNQRGGIAKSEAYRISKKNGVPTGYFEQESKNDRTRRFGNIRLGLDYFMDDYNSLSISRQVTSGLFLNLENQTQEYFDAQNILERTGNRTGRDETDFKRNNLQVNYRRTFQKEGKEWTADFTYGGRENSSTNDIVNSFFDLNGNLLADPNLVNNIGNSNENQYTFQTDYVNPISESSRLELGARFFNNISNDKLDVFGLNNGTATKLSLSNNYGFKERVYAAYGNYSNKINSKWKYQGGLRIETSSFRGELKDSAQSFGYDFPGKNASIWNALFPSVFLTYSPKAGNDFQVNFSRRIGRPRFWQINPYVDITDPQNIRKGNPQLRPEFTNSFELNYNKTYDKGNIFMALYFRNNTQDITSYTDTINSAQLEQLNSAAVEPNALLSTFINADRTNRLGMELTWQHKIGDKFEIAPNFNAQYRDVKAQVNGLNLSNSGFNWDLRLMTNYKLSVPKSKIFNNLSFQLQGEYESPEVIPQGRSLAQYEFDFAIRKDFLKNNAGTLTFNINDIFNSQRWGNVTETETFFHESYRRWNVRSFRLTFSYRFGNRDLQIFKSRQGGGEDRG
jgi:outer membrane receptor protein involved in Fe transport